jgi:hypothetical protein
MVFRPNIIATPTTAATIDVSGKNVSGPKYANISVLNKALSFLGRGAEPGHSLAVGGRSETADIVERVKPGSASRFHTARS